ncbi:AMP-binding protein, partial [Fulvivirga imtechensis]|uniref:AMP-binding protein n=1 Tax=Fulvivirga imtechensis TaxID=881893 RepID=UPI00058AECA7
KTIIDLFEEQVALTPDNIAVVSGDHSLTYQLLKERSDKVAIYLQQEQDVQPGDMVGVLLEREEQLLPVIFGILKSGGVYVPLSPHHPSARVKGIISDSGMKALITRTEHVEALELEMASGLVDLDEAVESISSQRPVSQSFRAKGNDLAYVIYTSGST